MTGLMEEAIIPIAMPSGSWRQPDHDALHEVLAADYDDLEEDDFFDDEDMDEDDEDDDYFDDDDPELDDEDDDFEEDDEDDE